MSGQFLSVDPKVQQTLQAFQYANDDPVGKTDPLGEWVVGVCGGIALSFGGSFEGSVCLVRTVGEPWDDIGIIRTVGFGWGTPGSSVSVGLLVSNARRIEDLGGQFNDASLSVGIVGVNVFWGPSHRSSKTVIGVVLQYGLSTNPFVTYGYTFTWTSVERIGAIANPMRWAWDGAIDALGGYSHAQLWLSLARAVAKHR